MTCVVGIEYKGGVLIGADSAGVSGNMITPRADKKVFFSRCNRFIFGFTSSFRMGQILEHSFLAPDRPPRMKNDFEFLVGHFIPHLMNTMTEMGHAYISNNRVSGGVFLMGYRNKLYRIDSDFQVGRSLLGYESVGCGEEYALGSLHTSKAVGMIAADPGDAAKHALESAAKFSTGVCGPFNFVNLDSKG